MTARGRTGRIALSVWRPLVERADDSFSADALVGARKMLSAHVVDLDNPAMDSDGCQICLYADFGLNVLSAFTCRSVRRNVCLFPDHGLLVLINIEVRFDYDLAHAQTVCFATFVGHFASFILLLFYFVVAEMPFIRLVQRK